MKFSVFGSNGFIGSNVVQHLIKNNFEYKTPDIKKDNLLNEDLGHVIYCLGITNVLKNPYRAVDAHVCMLKKILEKGKFDSFLYLSSTRIYNNNSVTNEETDILVNPLNQNELYNISKILGESICVASGRENVRIVRLSNVTGNNFFSHLFIPSIIRDAVEKNEITLHSTLDSEKDYIHINDVVQLLLEIIIRGKYTTYNIANGINTKSKEILDEISRVTNCKIKVVENGKYSSTPKISIERIREEFDFQPKSIISKLENIIKSYQEYISKN